MFTFDYEGASFPFDMTNVETVERYEAAAEQLDKDGKKAPKDGKKSAVLRYVMNAYDTFFNSVFGDSAASKLFGDNMSVSKREEAFMCLLDTIKSQDAEIVAKRARYSPNRAQRRAKG